MRSESEVTQALYIYLERTTSEILSVGNLRSMQVDFEK